MIKVTLDSFEVIYLKSLIYTHCTINIELLIVLIFRKILFASNDQIT